MSSNWMNEFYECDCPRPTGRDPLHVRNEYDLHANRGLSAFDPGRRFVTSLVYELPFGSGKSLGSRLGPLSHAIGGWQIGSIVTFADGLPTDVGTIGDSLKLCSSSVNYPNATAISPFIASPTRTRFWNVAAF